MMAFVAGAAWFATPALGGPLPSPGRLYGFGNNRHGQLGNETNSETQEPNPSPLPVTLPGQEGPVVGVAGGDNFGLAVTEGGQLYAFGYNLYGQLGTTKNIEFTFEPGLPPEPLTLPGEDGPVTEAAAGCDFSLAVTEGGQLYAFGENDLGQLGNSTHIEETTAKANPTPTLVTLPGEDGPVVAAAAGCFHSLALTSTGQLYAFGANFDGELGHERNSGANPTPTRVVLPGEDGPVVQIAAGGEFSLAVTESGQLYAFGNNRYGQLGFAANSGPVPNPSENAHPTPTLVSLPGQDGPVVQVAAGNNHSLALTESGRLYAFGENRYGQLGNTTNNGPNNGEANPTPTLVTLPGAGGRVAQISAAEYDSLALTSTGQLFTFGWNYYGELGNPVNNETSNPNPTPKPVAMPGGAAVSTIVRGPDASATLVTVGLLVDTTSLPEGTVGDSYEAEVQVAGGEAPYRWSATGLPPGISIDPQTGTLSGTPGKGSCREGPCHYSVAFTVTDGGGLEASKTIGLTLARDSYDLTIATGGSGSGDVDSSPTGITECGSPMGVCEGSYANGTVVTLTAHAGSGSEFAGWSGGGCSGTAPCRVTLGAETEVAATFDTVPLPPASTHTLTVEVTGDGAGSVIDGAGAIACPSNCSHGYSDGTQVSLTATAASGSRFAGWSGGSCSGTGPCRLTIGADETVSANFTKEAEMPKALAPARLHIVGARWRTRSSRPLIVVTGTIVKAARGTVVVRIGSSSAGRRATAATRARIVDGHWRARFAVPWARGRSGARRISVTARFAGTSGIRAGRSQRVLKLS